MRIKWSGTIAEPGVIQKPDGSLELIWKEPDRDLPALMTYNGLKFLIEEINKNIK